VAKRPYNVTSTFFNTVHLLSKDLRFEHGALNLLIVPVPSNLVTDVRPWHGAQNKAQETIRKDFNFCAPCQSGAHVTCHAWHTLDTPLALTINCDFKQGFVYQILTEGGDCHLELPNQ